MKHSTHSALIAALATLLGAVNPSGAAGVVIWKEQPFHHDGSASAAVYTRARSAPPVMFFTIQGKEHRFLPTTFFRFIEVPTALPEEIVTPEQIAQVRSVLGNLEAFGNRYAKAKALLATTCESMKPLVAKLDSGMVRHQGKWIERTSYLQTQKEQLAEKERKRTEALAKREQERKDAEARERLERELAEKSEKLRKEAAARVASEAQARRQASASNESKDWSGPEKNYVPIKTPWVTLCVPKSLKFCDLDIEKSFSFNAVSVSYVDPQAPIAVMTEKSNRMTMIVYKDIDEQRTKSWPEDEIKTEKRDRYVAELQAGDTIDVLGKTYRILIEKPASGLRNRKDDEGVPRYARVRTLPEQGGLPVIDLEIFAQPREKLEALVDECVGMIKGMLVENVDAQDVLANWAMNASVSNVTPMLRPTDAALGSLWRGAPPRSAFNFANAVGFHYPFPIMGSSGRDLRFWYGDPTEMQLGEYSIVQYVAPNLVIGSGMDRPPTMIRWLVVSVLVFRPKDMVVGYEITFSPISRAWDLGPDSEARGITDDDVTGILKYTQKLAPPMLKLSPAGAKQAKKDVDAGSFVQKHAGVQGYENGDGTFAGVIDFGTWISKPGVEKFCSGQRLLFSFSDTLEFLQQHNFRLAAAFDQSRRGR